MKNRNNEIITLIKTVEIKKKERRGWGPHRREENVRAEMQKWDVWKKFKIRKGKRTRIGIQIRITRRRKRRRQNE